MSNKVPIYIPNFPLTFFNLFTTNKKKTVRK